MRRNHAILEKFNWIITKLIRNNNTKMYGNMWKISGVRKVILKQGENTLK